MITGTRGGEEKQGKSVPFRSWPMLVLHRIHLLYWTGRYRCHYDYIVDEGERESESVWRKAICTRLSQGEESTKQQTVPIDAQLPEMQHYPLAC